MRKQRPCFAFLLHRLCTESEIGSDCPLCPCPYFDWMTGARGSIKLVRAGVYRLRVDAGRDPLTGRRLQPSRTVYGSRREAQETLSRWLVDLGRHGSTPSVMTVADLFERWISAPGRGGRMRKSSTVYRERRRFLSRVAPNFGHRPARSLTSGEVARFYDSLITTLRFSPASVHRIHEQLHAMFEFALRREILADNPLGRVIPPSVELKAPEAPEFEELMSHLTRLREERPRIWLAVRMSATLGLRRSDVLALKWRHINLATGDVDIEDGVTWVPGEGLVVSTTKTGEIGSATLPVDESLLEILVGEFAQVAEHAKAARIDPVELFVFASNGFDSNPIHGDTLTANIRKHCTTHRDLQPFTPQMLRAFTASELEGEGCDVTTAAAVLRHRSVQTTQRHYRAARERRMREATRTLGGRMANL